MNKFALLLFTLFLFSFPVIAQRRNAPATEKYSEQLDAKFYDYSQKNKNVIFVSNLLRESKKDIGQYKSIFDVLEKSENSLKNN